MTQTELFPAVPQQLRVAALVALGGAGVSACAKDVLRILLYELPPGARTRCRSGTSRRAGGSAASECGQIAM